MECDQQQRLVAAAVVGFLPTGPQTQQKLAKELRSAGIHCAGGGGGHSNFIPRVLTKFFRSLEKTGSLGTFCTFQTWPLKKGMVFTIHREAG